MGKNHIRYKYAEGKFSLDKTPYRLGGHDYTLSSMTEANGKLFYRTKGDITAGIRCIDLATHKITDVQVPFQIINGKKIWIRRDRNGKYLVFPKGVYDAQGKAIYTRESNHSYRCYGWGHIVCTAPVQVGDMLYWGSALGLICAIDLTGDFSPEKVQTFTVDPIGEAWTQGQLAYHDDHIYVRSQQALFKIRVKK